jgi:hypothetical protein
MVSVRTTKGGNTFFFRERRSEPDEEPDRDFHFPPVLVHGELFQHREADQKDENQ